MPDPPPGRRAVRRPHRPGRHGAGMASVVGLLLAPMGRAGREGVRPGPPCVPGLRAAGGAAGLRHGRRGRRAVTAVTARHAEWRRTKGGQELGQLGEDARTVELQTPEVPPFRGRGLRRPRGRRGRTRPPFWLVDAAAHPWEAPRWHGTCGSTPGRRGGGGGGEDVDERVKRRGALERVRDGLHYAYSGFARSLPPSTVPFSSHRDERH